MQIHKHLLSTHKKLDKISNVLKQTSSSSLFVETKGQAWKCGEVIFIHANHYPHFLETLQLEKYDILGDVGNISRCDTWSEDVQWPRCRCATSQCLLLLLKYFHGHGVVRTLKVWGVASFLLTPAWHCSALSAMVAILSGHNSGHVLHHHHPYIYRDIPCRQHSAMSYVDSADRVVTKQIFRTAEVLQIDCSNICRTFDNDAAVNLLQCWGTVDLWPSDGINSNNQNIQTIFNFHSSASYSFQSNLFSVCWSQFALS